MPYKLCMMTSCTAYRLCTIMYYTFHSLDVKGHTEVIEISYTTRTTLRWQASHLSCHHNGQVGTKLARNVAAYGLP